MASESADAPPAPPPIQQNHLLTPDQHRPTPQPSFTKHGGLLTGYNYQYAYNKINYMRVWGGLQKVLENGDNIHSFGDMNKVPQKHPMLLFQNPHNLLRACGVQTRYLDAEKDAPYAIKRLCTGNVLDSIFCTNDPIYAMQKWKTNSLVIYLCVADYNADDNADDNADYNADAVFVSKIYRRYAVRS